MTLTGLWGRRAVNYMDRDPGPHPLYKPVEGKPRTRPDGKSGDILFEDKFGPSASLSAGQRLARDKLKEKYVIYHFVPEHIAQILSLPTAGLAPQMANPVPAPRRGAR